MYCLNILVAVSVIASVSAFAPQSNLSLRKVTNPLQESFGFDFAEDPIKNTPAPILGEANYKQWVGEITDNSFLNRQVRIYHLFFCPLQLQLFYPFLFQYNAVGRIRELDLLKLTADYEILSKLEKNGLDLAKIESLLPQAENLGLLSLVANNQQLLINLVAPLLIEPAPLLLPVVAGALEVGPTAFYLASLSLVGVEAFLLTNNVEVPFVGLSAGAVAGLLLVPLAVLTGGLGAFFSSLKK
jgi:hypothetical protein